MTMNKDAYSKTARGLAEISRPRLGLPPNAYRVLKLVDGQSDFDQLLSQGGKLAPEELQRVLDELLAKGLIRRLATEAEDAGFASGDTAISVTEHDPEEGVRVWAEARRCAQALQETGFYVVNENANAPGTGLQALVVEDTLSTAQIEMELLKREGFAVHHAVNGKTAWELLQTMVPNLIILDVNLPDTNGFRILHALRQHSRLKQAPVIMVTSHIDEESVRTGIREGADGYLFKPFQAESLIGCVRRVVKTGGMAAHG